MMKKNILIVDDGYLNRLLIKKFIDNPEIETYEAENGLEALEVLKTNHIDLIFMDMQMPVMSGVEATRIIRKEMPSPTSETPIVAVTAYSSDLFDNSNFNKILIKPIQQKHIENIINSYLFSQHNI